MTSGMVGATDAGRVRVRCGTCWALLEVSPREREADNDAIVRAGWVVIETPDPASKLIWSRWYCSRACEREHARRVAARARRRGAGGEVGHG